MGVSGGIFLVDWSGLTFFMGRRGWVEVYFGCVAVSGVGGGDHLFKHNHFFNRRYLSKIKLIFFKKHSNAKSMLFFFSGQPNPQPNIQE